VAGGADPVDYLSRYKGRYRMVHLKDMKTIHKFAGDGGTPDQWISMFQYLTYLGDGAIDVKHILSAAEQSGVEHFFVEQDKTPNPEVSLKASADYLKSNGFS
jgi:sugar phosphate isomerase/epimerase